MTVATLAMSGNLDGARLLLIAIGNGVDRKFDANLTSFVSILSVPDAFLVLRDFRIKFKLTQITFRGHIIFNFDYARMIFILFDNAM